MRMRLMIDYKLAKEIGATHYHSRTGEMYKVDLGSLLVFRRDDWVHSGLPLGEAVSKIKPIPPKRTRTEYEKVTESIFDLRDHFECGMLFFPVDTCRGKEYFKVEDVKRLGSEYQCGNLFLRVEKEIDWRDEVIAFRDTCKFGGDDLLPDYFSEHMAKEDWYFMSNDDFLELCRVALCANGEIE